MATSFTFTDASVAAAATDRTFLEMKQTLQRRSRNSTIPTSSDELKDWFDDAREFLMDYLFECMKSTQTVTTVASQAEYPLSSRVTSIYVVKFTTDIEKILRPVDLQEVDRGDPSPSTTTYPDFYYMNGSQILGLYLTPSTSGKTLTVRGYAELDQLSGDNDTWPAQIVQLGMQYVYARWLEYDGHERAPGALAELINPLNGEAGPMLRRALVKDRRSLDRTRYIKGGRRGARYWTRLLDQDFPVGTW